ncbi:hypothetical protein CY34DRAFT_331777 [Suillus luteus UH-Slu-Lm8-n1]|uniref:Unplaced genomic scaffold CY34scaffold_21, whole genome shotgun sequence n=1 Tax=Suillus luteus UH-Slu-Lm8-n1 TaxID=930992 RepID=A0A0D0BVK9_9AGAM|nr:hypothetical protein CY34DRAFT_331777 [Suillus luteus UH-Slu-Lm8-n1]
MFIFVMPILAIQARQLQLDGGISSMDARSLSIPNIPTRSLHPSNMAVVSNDPSWWPLINANIVVSYWIVVTVVVVVYDWVITIGKEIELIWRQSWSLMTVMYLVIRYIGIPFAVANALSTMPMVSLTDAVSNIIIYAVNWTNVVQATLLGVIMIARLYAMYQGSRIMLIFLVIIFLGINIACGVMTAIGLKHYVAEELILSGMHVCGCDYGGSVRLLISMVWMLNTVWEVLALCLAAWIAIKHIRDLRRHGPSAGLATVRDVLIKSHVLYFASFASVSCLQFSNLSLVLTILLELRHFMVLLVFYWSCRSLCWHHASSLVSETITQNSLPTPTQTLA